jgi:acyl-CoA thioesterase
MSDLSSILHSAQATDGAWAYTTDDSWLQGRSLFGGLQAAIAVDAMQKLQDPMPPLRTLQATLCAPISGPQVQVQTRLLRAGKNTLQCAADFIEGETLIASFVGIFGQARESALTQTAQALTPAAEQGMTFPFIPKITPAFIQHFEAELLAGHFPFTGGGGTQQQLRLSLKDADTTAGAAQVLALADFPPPLALSHFRKPVPGSTLTWMLNLVQPELARFDLQNWITDVHLEAGADGYTHQSVRLYGPDRSLVALSRQCMVVFG